VGWEFWYCGHYWPIVPVPDDRWWRLWRNWWNEDWQRKPKYSEKTCPSATLSITNPTWLDPGLNPGRRGGKPATNRLSNGAASIGHMLLGLSIPGDVSSTAKSVNDDNASVKIIDCYLFWSIIPASPWMNWRNPRTCLLIIGDIVPGIRNRGVPNTAALVNMTLAVDYAHIRVL
jgi:hypothetical protein